MTTEKQLTLSDLAKLQPAIKVAAICRRAGVDYDATRQKLKRLRDGTTWPGNELDPDQAERLSRALRELWEELGAVIGAHDE